MVDDSPLVLGCPANTLRSTADPTVSMQEIEIRPRRLLCLGNCETLKPSREDYSEGQWAGFCTHLCSEEKGYDVALNC